MNKYNDLIDLLKRPPVGRDNADIMIVAADAIERLVKERDAAVADISWLIVHRFEACKICEHRFSADPENCLECDNVAPWGCFKWRGVTYERMDKR